MRWKPLINMRWKPLIFFPLILCCLALACSDDSDDMIKDDIPVVNNTPPTITDDVSLPQAAAFTLVNTELEEVSLSDYRGKVVLLDFWATWCEPCKEEIPLFIGLYDQYQAEGFEMVGISLDDEGLKVVDPFIEELGVNYEILLGDAEIIQKYDVPLMPSAFLINRDGKIVKLFTGAQGSREIYEEELKKLL